MERTKLGAFIFAARKKQRLTTRDVSALAKGMVSAPYISDIENHEKEVTPDKLRVIAKALNIDYLKLMKVAGYL